MRLRYLAGLLVMTSVVTACGDGRSLPIATGSSSPPVTQATRYEVSATVLQSPAHGPELCAGIVLHSLPPQCGGPAVAGWDWTTVPEERSFGGVTWGEYHVVGTYDGTTFTLTAPATAAHPAPTTPLPDFATPCAAPPGGWAVTDPGHVGLDAYQALTSGARAQPDFAGMWLDRSTAPPSAVDDLTKDVMNVAFTGDLDRHRTELAAIWGGPLCVLRQPHSHAALREVSTALIGGAGQELGLQMLSAGIDDVGNIVRATAIVVDADAQSAVDQRFGAGLVELRGVLQPVR